MHFQARFLLFEFLAFGDIASNTNPFCAGLATIACCPRGNLAPNWLTILGLLLYFEDYGFIVFAPQFFSEQFR